MRAGVRKHETRRLERLAARRSTVRPTGPSLYTAAAPGEIICRSLVAESPLLFFEYAKKVSVYFHIRFANKYFRPP